MLYFCEGSWTVRWHGAFKLTFRPLVSFFQPCKLLLFVLLGRHVTSLVQSKLKVLHALLMSGHNYTTPMVKGWQTFLVPQLLS
jgi:hypothetical protein